jgi:holin-like protein
MTTVGNRSQRPLAIDLRALTLAARRRARRSRIIQICLILALWGASAGAVRLLALPVPSGMLGLTLALILLATRRISLFTLRRGAEWFVGEMMLFFVPAVVSILDHPEFIGPRGLELLAVIVLSTLAVVIVTALTVELIYRWRLRLERT